MALSLVGSGGIYKATNNPFTVTRPLFDCYKPLLQQQQKDHWWCQTAATVNAAGIAEAVTAAEMELAAVEAIVTTVQSTESNIPQQVATS